MKQLILLLFICLSGIININAQSVVKGIVTDKKTNEPVSYASVYINGSSGKVTRTDNKGCFKLEGVTFPSLLVVSHLNYNLKTIELEDNHTDSLAIRLIEKNQQLGELTVQGKSLRKQSVEEFRKAFLGTDSWGTKARLLNDSVLVFSRRNDTINVKKELVYVSDILDTQFGEQSTNTITQRIQETFIAKTKAPLLVDLPLLGYTLSVDLVEFAVYKTNSRLSANTSMLGYFNFKPYDSDNKRKQAKYEKNRQQVYYNSPLHFNRALFNNSFKANGYVLLNYLGKDSLNQNKYSFVKMDTALNYMNKEVAILTGLKGKQFSVLYLTNSDGKPLNLSLNPSSFDSFNTFAKTHWQDLSKIESSVVYFLDNTCTVRNNGTTPENKIAFGGAIGQKKAATLLPDDYEPVE